MIKAGDWFFGPKGFRYTFSVIAFWMAFVAIIDIGSGNLFWGAWQIVCLVWLCRSSKKIMRHW